ncbi:acetoacetate--CoA ligase [Mesobacillus harenae]|uniref:acetoacetate--CoA ligase n=1 Tax=Mesobacillus harenae TaxID=2213203 RepID=UPI001580082A|nr:acetoacetate--CoA ligase [Mesobacillus harenae]
MKAVTDGQILWEPSQQQLDESNMSRYMTWLKKHKGLSFNTQQELWKWSVEELENFWESIWEFSNIRSAAPYDTVLVKREMPGAKWFPGARINFADHVFRHGKGNKPALIFQSEHVGYSEISWSELQEKTAAVAASLKNLGVKPGDRVVAFMPNIPETIIAFLACASIGAIWSSCSPDFGTGSVIDRFKQIEPVVLFTIDGYQYNGKPYDKSSVITQLQDEIPSLKHTILVPYLNSEATHEDTLTWSELIKESEELAFEFVPFDHPLWVLYSSGTTGLPKPIVQGQGGILLTHLKTMTVEGNYMPEDRVFWFTTTGWMMWNSLVGGLLAGSTIVLYDGSPAYPDLYVLWDLAEKAEISNFGTSAAYINLCMKNGIVPKENRALPKLKAIGATASPLTAEGFHWVYENVKGDLVLSSTSGGTDVCTSFVGGSPILPVKAGKIQCRSLGCKVESFDDSGNSLMNEVGELVLTEPMPSMPLYFWNDPDNERYLESYFEMYPNVWRHGDWIKIEEDGSCVIYGRSDSTLNRHGVRMGTSELYRAVEALDEVVESLVIDLSSHGRKSFMPLFVVLKPGQSLDDSLKRQIETAVKDHVSPRFIPDEIYQIEEVPKTLNGKKLEVPIRKILLGFPLEKAANPGAMANPESLAFFQELAKELNDKEDS